MKFRFLFLGKTRSSYLDEGIKDFLKRIKKYHPAEEIVLKAARVRDDKSEEVRREDTERLLGAVQPGEVFVHLDPKGKQLTSEQLAEWTSSKIVDGVKSIAFGLGGPLGLTNAAAKRADLRLCISKMTLTHEMCRLVLAEQVYRSLRIIAGHPYHK